jgi:hypothetical protein
MDTEMLQVMAAAEDAAVNRLRTETHKRIGTGFITPSGWLLLHFPLGSRINRDLRRQREL